MEVVKTVRVVALVLVTGLTEANVCCRYWQFLLYLFIGLTIMELIVAPMRWLYPAYSLLVGYVGLSVEATLPLPQIYSNARSRSCKGFRFSVLASWLLGDTMKMFWFFTSTTEIPWAFKLCGIFQAGCDLFLGLQYIMYGSGDAVASRDLPMASWGGNRNPKVEHIASGTAGGRRTPTGRMTPVEKDI